AQHLEVRVDAGLRPPDGFENQAPVEEDRRVALLARVRPGQRAIRRVPRRVIPRLHGSAAKAAAGRSAGAPGRDRVEQAETDVRMPVRVEEGEARERAD